MGAFSDIELDWKGQVYVVKSHRVMGAISRIEEIVTLPEIQEYARRGTVPLAKLSMALGAVLRYAGASVTDDDIYSTALSSSDSGVMMSVMAIMQVMLPPEVRRKLETDAPSSVDIHQGNGEATTAKGSSKQPTKRRSQKANG